MQRQAASTLWRHTFASWRVFIALFGMFVCAIALVGPWVGLDQGPDFFFYRVFGITRKSMCYFGIALAIAPVVPYQELLKFVTRLFPAASIRDEFAHDTQPKISRQLLSVLIGQLALAA